MENQLNDSISWEDFSSRLDDYIDLTKKLAYEDKLFRAHKVLDYVVRVAKRFSSDQSVPAEEMKIVQDKLDEKLNHGEFEKNMIKETIEMKTVIKMMESNEGWTLVREHNGIKTLYRNEENTPVHSIKLQGVIEAPLLHVLSIINEIDLYKNWWPLSKEVTELMKFSKYRKLIRLMVDLPWPVWNRDGLLYGYGVDNLEENRMMIVFRSATAEELKPIGDLANTPPNTVRSEWQVGGVLLVPISPEKTEVCISANVDAKLGLVPYSILNTFTKYLSPLAFERLKEQAKKIKGSEYEKRIETNTDIYTEIINRMRTHFDNLDTTHLNNIDPSSTSTNTTTSSTSSDSSSLPDINLLSLNDKSSTTDRSSLEKKNIDIDNKKSIPQVAPQTAHLD